jgi:hypothetical protein
LLWMPSVRATRFAGPASMKPACNKQQPNATGQDNLLWMQSVKATRLAGSASIKPGGIGGNSMAKAWVADQCRSSDSSNGSRAAATCS